MLCLAVALFIITGRGLMGALFCRSYCHLQETNLFMLVILTAGGTT